MRQRSQGQNYIKIPLNSIFFKFSFLSLHLPGRCHHPPYSQTPRGTCPPEVLGVPISSLWSGWWSRCSGSHGRVCLGKPQGCGRTEPAGPLGYQVRPFSFSGVPARRREERGCGPVTGKDRPSCQSGGAPAVRPGAVAQSPGREAALAWARVATRVSWSPLSGLKGVQPPLPLRQTQRSPERPRQGSALPRLGAELELRRSGSSVGPSQ